MINATISISVPPLSDNAPWFVNAAAWSNYWSGISGDIELTPITVTTYTDVPYNAALQPASITIDTTNFVLATQAQFTSLLAAYTALRNNYIALRGELYAAGLISAP